MPEPDRIQILEAALFSAREPMRIDQMRKLFGDAKPPSEGMLREALDRLATVYADRAVQLVEVAGGFRFQVSEDFAPYLAKLSDEKPGRYSRATLETLAMIAYRQPVTRGEIESVRGVAVNTQIIRTLEERGWITVVGHKEVPGRPALFATTTQFLDDFGLKTLDHLPEAAELISPPTEDLLDQMESSDE
jgi:segregation and condensation protein B